MISWYLLAFFLNRELKSLINCGEVDHTRAFAKPCNDTQIASKYVTNFNPCFVPAFVIDSFVHYFFLRDTSGFHDTKGNWGQPKYTKNTHVF